MLTELKARCSKMFVLFFLQLEALASGGEGSKTNLDDSGDFTNSRRRRKSSGLDLSLESDSSKESLSRKDSNVSGTSECSESSLDTPIAVRRSSQLSHDSASTDRTMVTSTPKSSHLDDSDVFTSPEL